MYCLCSFNKLIEEKIGSKSRKLYFIGYTLEQKGYCCYYNPDKHEICVSKDVVFDELKIWYGTSKCIYIEGENDEATMKAAIQESCELSKPSKSFQMPTKVSLWLGRC